MEPFILIFSATVNFIRIYLNVLYRAFRLVVRSSFVFANSNCDWVTVADLFCCFQKQIKIQLQVERLYWFSATVNFRRIYLKLWSSIRYFFGILWTWEVFSCFLNIADDCLILIVGIPSWKISCSINLFEVFLYHSIYLQYASLSSISCLISTFMIL